LSFNFLVSFQKPISHSPPPARTRLTACPPCTGTIHQKYFTHQRYPLKNPLGTDFTKDANGISNNASPCRQKRTHHGHHNRATYAIIHLNTQIFGDYASRLTPLHRSDNPSPNLWTSFLQNQFAHPNAPKPIHPDKEHLCSPTIKLGANLQTSSESDLFRSKNLEDSKHEFPCTNTPAP